FAFLSAKAQITDSTIVEPPSFKESSLKQFVLPTALIGTGLLTIGDRPYFSSQDTYNYLQKRWPNAHTRADDITFIVPVVTVYGLNALGIKGKHGFLERTLLFALSATLANSISLSLKHNVNYLRPDGSEFNSFPSGHTTNAFVASEFMHQEYKSLCPWYSVYAYSFSIATGSMRLVNNRHWMSDVLVGAGLGMISTKAVYLAYPSVKRGIKKRVLRREL
ncbi:MAG: phosphatase PAP2 family protein, partial [Bacteroidetes bacterium]|nr:phosphatase PAP2 family protein [Bacteroidota bacterium]